ncbi:MAG TPA: ATP-grasp domain-containing protein [Gaiellaceae bacterium]|nr:ATP-grasp domain-containing protein [Gaiellaceae bacterium]
MAANPPDRVRCLLVLGAGPAQLGLLEAARAHGIWTAVCDRDPAAPGFAFAGRRCIVSIEDETAIERLASALPLDGLIAPGTDESVAVAARVAEKLGLTHPVSPQTAILATSKSRQRAALEAAGIPQPRWQLVSDEDEIELPLPLVVKPADRTRGRGLSVVSHSSELPAALAAARAASRTAAIVEEYVGGDEVTVTGFSAAGEFLPLAVIDRSPAPEPAFGVPLAQSWPSPHAAAAAEVARRAVEALGIENGPSFTQLRLSRGGPEVIEVAARVVGGHDAELVELVTGIDLNALALAAALGRPVTPGEVAGAFRPSVAAAATRFLVAPNGRLESVEVPEGQKGVVSTRLYRGRGHLFGPLRRSSDRAGAVLAVGSTPDEALARADAAAERIRFLTADAPALPDGSLRQVVAHSDVASTSAR